jgi:hypothetical protein
MFIFFSKLLFDISNQVIPFLALNIFFVGNEKGSNTWNQKFMVMASNPLPIKKDEPSREVFFQHEWVATRPF